ncbi:hypothetical protein ND861_12675 [Leptospira sp. 2 VSF19]|uniref:Galactose oxidase n=1 Tax=Leptospira soteropolitanensis TaxID=2950025 RepID=A0AAW5VF05_9LEPT|nr:hypothetical protein [Leptospira soteropolitanensis]MCW7493495.1 hypothetical protein [Leptospira soteropolitanensis]MCW7500973.1 hypothetical protein [Leptospira soteropolitanensis]MCW7523347.1 hypothetical protein [Leptospira soteropolitanensis]MCW7527208.1 hypothetical protein [Leptospira soteropolitanensis]MCW7531065.1 hypothetical protein [Leptospira soteropolitanensis]
MARLYSFFGMIIFLTLSASHCKPADLENACDVKSKAFLLGTIIRYVTGDHSPSCLPSFSFFDQWGVYGPTARVNAITSYEGKIILGGEFTMTGVPTGSASMVDPITGAVIPNRSCPHLKVKGLTNVAISDGSGGFYIGGDFTHVQGIKRSQIAHILPGCQLDPNFVPVEDPTRNITALSLLGDNLYVGGMFSGWGSGSQINIASINRITGHLNPGFLSPSYDNSVFDIVTDGSALYVGGHFQSIGGNPRYGLVKLSPITGAIDSSFTGQAPAGGQVNDLHLGTDHTGSNVLYIVGPFTGQAMSFYLNGTQTSWAPNPNMEVYKINQFENTIYLGGEFTTIGVSPSNYLVGVDNQLGAIKENSFALNSFVRNLNVIGNKIYILGEFTEAKGQKRNYAASFDLPSQNLNQWDPSLNSSIYFPAGDIVLSGSTILIGSNHSAINTKLRNNFVVFDEETGYPVDNTPNFDYSIKALHIKDNHLFVGGSFENINGIPRVSFAILDLPSYHLNPTNIGVSPAGTDIRTITSNENQIFFSGFGMTSVGGQSRNAIAAIDSKSFGLTAWNPDLGVSGSASTLLVVNDLIFVGGIFNSLNGDGTVINYRAVDTASGVMRPIPSNTHYPGNGVNGQTYFEGKIYLGGIFTSIGSLGSFNHIAVFDTQTQNYSTPNYIYADGMVSSLTASPEGKVIVTGSFSAINSNSASQYIAAFDAKTNSILDWSPNPSDVGNASYYKNGKWFIGGDFNNAFNKPYGAFFISEMNEKK